jgi:hypothetical protein
MRIRQKRSKEDSYPNTVGQEKNILLQNFNRQCNQYLKAWIITSNIDPQAQAGQTTSFERVMV